MKKLNFIILFLFSFSLYSQNTSTYILKTNRSISAQKLKTYLKIDKPIELDELFSELNLFTLKTTESIETVDRLRNLDIIEYIEKDIKLEYRNTPNDKYYPNQFGITQIQADRIWDTNTGGLTGIGDTIVIAVLDEGMDINHSDLKSNIWRNHGEIPNDHIDNDNNGYVDDYFGVDMKNKNDNHNIHYHGTSVAGIIGAKGNNNIGIAGVNWNIKILPITNISSVSDVLRGYHYVIKERKKYNDSNGKKGSLIVATNLSAGIANEFPDNKNQFIEWCNLYDTLGLQGILNISSVVNSAVDVEEVGDMPTLCKSKYLITVTSTTESKVFDSDRGYGETSVDLAAPGKNIVTLSVDNGYKTKFTGNSAAAPFVAGSIGLLYTIPCQGFTDKILQSPSQLSLKIKEFLLNNTDKHSSLESKTVSGGRLNVYNTYLKLSDLCGDVETGKFGIIDITPNPAFSDKITVKYNTDNLEETISIIVSNRIGQIVYDSKFAPNIFGKREYQIDVSGFASGIYYVTIYYKKNKSTKAVFIY